MIAILARQFNTYFTDAFDCIIISGLLSNSKQLMMNSKNLLLAVTMTFLRTVQMDFAKANGFL